MAIGLEACEARVAELADAPDLGSGGQPWGFESPLSHSTAVQVNVRVLEPVHHSGDGPPSKGHARRTERVRMKESVHES